jgi:hypothetical protein
VAAKIIHRGLNLAKGAAKSDERAISCKTPGILTAVKFEVIQFRNTPIRKSPVTPGK